MRLAMSVLRLLLAPLLVATVLTACEKPPQAPPAPKLEQDRTAPPLPRTEMPAPSRSR